MRGPLCVLIVRTEKLHQVRDNDLIVTAWGLVKKDLLCLAVYFWFFEKQDNNGGI